MTEAMTSSTAPASATPADLPFEPLGRSFKAVCQGVQLIGMAEIEPQATRDLAEAVGSVPVVGGAVGLRIVQWHSRPPALNLLPAQHRARSVVPA
jgi:hypothetical protein